MSNLNRNYEDKPEMSNLDIERIIFNENYYYKMEELIIKYVREYNKYLNLITLNDVNINILEIKATSLNHMLDKID